MNREQSKDQLLKLQGIMAKLESEKKVAMIKNDYETYALKRGAFYFAKREYSKLSRRHYQLFIK